MLVPQEGPHRTLGDQLRASLVRWGQVDDGQRGQPEDPAQMITTTDKGEL